MNSDWILLIAAGLLLAISFYFILKKQPHYAVGLIIIGGCLLRIYVSLDPYLHLWDERFHALVAKHLIAHPLVPTLYDQTIVPLDYKNWGLTHVWLHKPPLALWSIALSLKIFGLHELSIRLPSIILSTCAIYLTYFIGKELFNKQVGSLAAFLHAINGFAIEITGGRIATDHVDVFFLFFIELSIVFAVLQYKTHKILFIIPFSISLALAIYTKWLPALVVIPVWAALNFDKHSFKNLFSQLLIILLITLILVIPWQIYIFKTFPEEAKWESLYNWKHITTVIEAHGGSWYYHILKGTIIWNELVWVTFIWFFVKTYRNRFHREYIALIIWVIIPYLFFSSINTKMIGYLLFTGPALFLIISRSWFDVLDIMRSNIRWKLPLAIVLLALILLSVRYSFERLKPGKRNHELVELTKRIKDLETKIKGEMVVIFNTPYFIEIMYYTPFTAYNIVPSHEEVNNFVNLGYAVYILEGSNVPKDLKNISGISVLSF